MDEQQFGKESEQNKVNKEQLPVDDLTGNHEESSLKDAINLVSISGNCGTPDAVAHASDIEESNKNIAKSDICEATSDDKNENKTKNCNEKETEGNKSIIISNEEYKNENKSIVKKKTKRNAFADSDSEEDDTSIMDDEPNKGNLNVECESISGMNGIVKDVEKRKTKRIAIIDSDSDDDNKNLKNVNDEPDIFETGLETHHGNSNSSIFNNPVKSITKRITIADSDSEDDKTFNNAQENEATVYAINEKGNLIPENSVLTYTSRLAALCDPESSEDENVLEDTKYDEPMKPKPYKKQKKLKENIDDDSKQMTGKEAMDQRREIRSESQRMVRELQVSLPYHVPKTRTIKEFLQKRPKFAVTVGKGARQTPPSIAIKMSRQQLEIVSKKMKEREKEVAEFYKSESDSDENNDKGNTSIQNNETEEIVKTIIVKPFHCGDEASSKDANFVDKADETQKDSQKIPDDSQMDIDEICSTPNCGIDNESHISAIDSIANKNNLAKDVNQETTNKCLDSSGEYSFNLDDIDLDKDDETANLRAPEAATTLIENDESNKQSTIPEEPSEESIEKSVKPISKLELLKAKLGTCKPRLSGGPDQVIDLDLPETTPSGVSQLMDRFFKHAAKKTHAKHNVQLSVVSVNGGEVHKETLAMAVESDEEVVIDELPGAKLKKLRNQLQNQMAIRRSEQWHQKRMDPAEIDIYNGEKSDCGMDDDILDDDEEVELTDRDTSDEEELEDDCTNEAKDKSDALVIDEAEEDADDEEDDNKDDASHDEISDDDATSQQSISSEKDRNNGKKALKRIVKAFEDSDEEDSCDTLHKDISQLEEKISAEVSDDDTLPPNQSKNILTPVRPITESKDFGFLTPINNLTGLQGLNSQSTFLHESPADSLFPLPPEPSPLRGIDWRQGSNKKLFYDNKDETHSTVDDLADLCSGHFPSQSQNVIESESSNKSQSMPINHNNEEPQIRVDEMSSNIKISEKERPLEDNPSTQDLAEICSGMFTGFTQDPNGEESNMSSIQTAESNLKTCCNVKSVIQIGTQSEIKNFDNDDEEKLISQLLDEEELEKFKKKFDSPLVPESQAADQILNATAGRVIFDSSDDEEDTLKLRKKKRQKKLVFSDDDESEAEMCSEEAIDLHDVDEDKENEEAPDVNYDSEENEIDMNNPKQKLKITEFFEDEAELSESEWGSADEDEKGLDTFEAELGDQETFDESEVKRDLEKIHMRRLLDDDNRDVKLLQEMLLEDGELHGTGRARQFRWKNIDSNGVENNEKEEDAAQDYDGECEEEWRKKRHERELFLRNAKEKSFEDETLPQASDSQVFKLGQKAIVKNTSSNDCSVLTSKLNVGSASPDIKQPFRLLHKRGSFLNRNEKVLQRIAEITKTSTANGVKNSRNFVFQTLQSKENVDSKKRKAAEGTPKAIKKLRLANLDQL